MHVEVDELRLGNEPGAVPRARHLVAALLDRWDAADLIGDAELVTTELVTNGLLYAGPPVDLGLRQVGNGVRIEVADRSHAMPVRAVANAETMTGRGLALIEALGHRWGGEPTADGKIVWCEVTRGQPEDELDGVDIDALLSAWDDRTGREPRFTIRLGDVPTDLLLAAKTHVDNLVREFTLASSGAVSGSSAGVPAPFAHLIQTVVHGFAEARLAIKRQALAAAARREPRTSLTLTLPASAADAGEEYLAALDEADAYARAARLLTLESPPQHRVFRHWYVESVVHQLRRAAAGEPPGTSQTFEQRLLAEFCTVAAAQRATDRAARLQSVTASLVGVTNVEDVAATVVSEGVAALGASGGSLLVRRDDDHFTVPGAVGYGDALVERLRAERRDADLPAAVAIRTGTPVWLESRQARDERFPELIGLEPRTISMCAVPLQVADRVLGALRFSFETPRLFDDDERRFVLALAAQTAQALDRSQLYAAERAARVAAESLTTRLARLQQVTAELTAVRDVEQVADIVVTHAADALGANPATMCLLEDQTLRIVGMRGARPGALERWRTFPLAAPLPVSEAVRTNAPVVVATRDELVRRFPLLADEVQREHSLVCVPLRVGDRRLGAVSLSFPSENDVTDAAQLSFLTSVADACAQAIDRSQALAAAESAREKLAFLAKTSAELAASLDYRTTLANIARLLVPQLADWCAVHIVEDGRCDPVAVAHADPEKAALARRVQRRCRVNPDARAGVARVVRTGVSELHPTVGDELLATAAGGDEQLRMLRALGLTSTLVVPLTGRDGTFGTISLGYAESGRRYTAEDLALAEDIARRAGVAVENARIHHQQSGRLAAITRVAEAAQRAILAPVPARVGPVALAAAYASAAREALVGGDLYEVVPRPGGVRLLIGDVRGKGLEAVRMATIVLGEFRSAVGDREDLVAAARRMDARLTPYLTAEDFVTALIAEITDEGRCEVVCCGHPPALLTQGGHLREVGRADSLPLGLGATPSSTFVTLTPGSRLLLYTDGMLEARDANGRFTDPAQVLAPLAGGAIRTVPERILDELRRVVGAELDDDLALLVAEYRPE